MNINATIKYYCNACSVNFITENFEFLVCPSCNIKILCIDSIPRFVKSDKYVNNFSFQWNIHRKTQFDSKENSVSEETFFRIHILRNV